MIDFYPAWLEPDVQGVGGGELVLELEAGFEIEIEDYEEP